MDEILNCLPETDKNVVCVLSGGLDSTILSYLLKHKYGDKVKAITFNYNQKHIIEVEKAKETCNKLNIPHRIINMEFLGDIVSSVSSLSKDSNIDIPNIKDVLGDPNPSSYVPFRNLIFLSLGLSFCESNNADVLFLGIQSHDLYGYWDTTQEFIDRLNSVAELCRSFPIKINAPFVDLSKKDEIEIGKILNVPFKDSWTCYEGRVENNIAIACGKCGSCAERIKNFMDANMIDPIEYDIAIKWKS